MQNRFPTLLTAALLGAASLSACGTTPAEDRERITFPARTDFPAASQGSLDTLTSGLRTYTLDSSLEASHLYVQLFAAGMGHSHVVRATSWTGTARFDPSKLEDCSVAVELQVEGLDPDRDEMRDLIVQDRLSQSDRDTIREHLRGADQLNLAVYKTLSFTSKACTLSSQKGEGGHPVVDVKGDMTVRGVIREVMLPLEVAVDEQKLAARGVLTTTHEDFGFKPYSALGGVVQNKPELYFVLDVRGQRKTQ
jgi:polyisoprenoid-binding protein YceI